MKASIKLAVLGSALLASPLASQAATDTADFDVLLNLRASCTIDQATDLDFGNATEAQVVTGGITGTSTVSVTCSNGAAYDIGLSGTNATRAMTSANGSSVSYELYQDSANSTAWENTTGTLVSDTGDSNQQDFTVYGLIPAQTPTINAADSLDGDTGVDLSDTVTVTVTF
ncbi:hypothetical protein A15D_00019 [Alcanivorax sp. MD8A]|uniref:Csu type fimbrial protein n=1 Tax=Alcanivorax sp. MD8A TaxID=1177157 RepID=UPI000CC7A094|nr:spore coat protein U domain-containing protein [Alcanivorax sp. MD8A]PNE04240.1 hypothetical protein A15D_00019 [Alcanivorax sp. MD8A]